MAQQWMTKDETELYREPDFRPGTIGTIPANVVLDEVDAREAYVKVAYGEQAGWAMRVELERYMERPKPDLLCEMVTKPVGKAHRHFFFLRNTGTMAYRGGLFLRLLDEQGKLLRSQVYASVGIEPGKGSHFFLDLNQPAKSFRLDPVPRMGRGKASAVRLALWLVNWALAQSRKLNGVLARG